MLSGQSFLPNLQLPVALAFIKHTNKSAIPHIRGIVSTADIFTSRRK
jgi:hypothetical protein